MAVPNEKNYHQSVERLTNGFGALIEQVQELARKNTDLEQRLARVREEAYYLTRSDGPLSHLNTTVWLQATQGATLEPRGQPRSGSDHGQEIWLMGSKDENNALDIAAGVKAWKTLTGWKQACSTQPDLAQSDGESTRSSKMSNPSHPPEQEMLPADHPSVGQNARGEKACPFASRSIARLGDEQESRPEASVTQRPGSLPTPPHTQEHFIDDPGHEETRNEHDSPPPSVSGSISKCPIRMLDERSPEEIARFFEIHKHEIPRSHEVCVRRYQSNAQSIRQLDAKYGNLANMIQGLGMKHQPLLPSKEEEEGEAATRDARSIRKVENWANDVEEAPDDIDLHSAFETNPSNTEHRDGHFDRPLKEIRIGESPSRPWGISVPGGGPRRDLNEVEAFRTPKEVHSKPGPPPPQTGATLPTRQNRDGHKEEKPPMIFTGPVFIGYGPEQAATLIRQSGLGAQGDRH